MTQHNYLINIANTIIHYDTVTDLNDLQLSKHPKHQKIWKKYFGNKLGRLSQEAGGHVEGTITTFFIEKDQVPRDQLKDISYGRIVVDYRPQKEEPHFKNY